VWADNLFNTFFQASGEGAEVNVQDEVR